MFKIYLFNLSILKIILLTPSPFSPQNHLLPPPLSIHSYSGSSGFSWKRPHRRRLFSTLFLYFSLFLLTCPPRHPAAPARLRYQHSRNFHLHSYWVLYFFRLITALYLILSSSFSNLSYILAHLFIKLIKQWNGSLLFWYDRFT